MTCHPFHSGIWDYQHFAHPLVSPEMICFYCQEMFLQDQSIQEIFFTFEKSFTADQPIHTGNGLLSAASYICMLVPVDSSLVGAQLCCIYR